MELDRQNPEPPSPGLPFPAKIALGALAVWGVLTLVQWFIASAMRFVSTALFVVIVVALFGWAVSSKGNR